MTTNTNRSTEDQFIKRDSIMKKVTTLLVTAFTTAIFAGSAMAATPAQHATKSVKTHQVHKQHHAKKHHTSAHKSATAKKVEDKTPATK